MSRQEVHALIVSEDRALLRTLSRFLNMFGYRVRQTTRRADVAAMIDAWACDLLIVDSGTTASVALELCSQITGDPNRTVHVMLLDDEGRGVDVEQAIRAGVDDVLAKPLRFGELLSRLRAGLRGIHWQRRALAQGDHDATTGLSGRITLTQYINAELPESQTACGVLSIDNLDVIGYRHGHDTVDHLLREFADALQEAMPEIELMASLARGGYAFAFPTSLDAASAREHIETVRESLAERSFEALAENGVHLALSVGFTLAGPIGAQGAGGEAAEAPKPTPGAIVIQQAEHALRSARRSGGECTVQFGQFSDEEREWKEQAQAGRLFETTVARDVMTPCPIVLRTGGDLTEAYRIFEQTHLDFIPVVDDAGKLAGVVTESIASSEAFAKAEAAGEKVLRVMNPAVATCSETEPFAELMRLLGLAPDRFLFVVHEGVPTGVIVADELSSLGRPVSHAMYEDGPVESGSEYLLIEAVAAEE